MPIPTPSIPDTPPPLPPARTATPGAPPPYAVAPHRFPFRALATLAARAPLGGAREVALACFMAARLAEGVRTGPALTPAALAARAASARGWFASLALPAALRTSVDRLIDAVARASAADVAPPLAATLAAARRHLDAPSIAELEQLLRALAAA